MLQARALDGLIKQDMQLHHGTPVIAGTGITVRAIAIMHKQGYSSEEITAELHVTVAQVHAGLT